LCAAEFLPDAAHCGLLRRFSARALDLALRQVAQWQRAGVWQHGERLSVNLPNRYLTEDSLPELLAELLRQHPLEPGTLSLDVHESALTDPGGPIHRVLKRLLDLDLLVAVDDFGSSQCALPMLAELRPYLLKLDAGVVEGINSLETSQNLARMALRIGEEIGSMVSAEGIERPEQLATLEVLGYRYGQGQLLTAPMPAEQVPIWLDKWQPTPFLSGETEQVPRIVH
jgi:EAL domain-containing protein (putative c-di-GMP-specific phosphodiesterase class I)